MPPDKRRDEEVRALLFELVRVASFGSPDGSGEEEARARLFDFVDVEGGGLLVTLDEGCVVSDIVASLGGAAIRETFGLKVEVLSNRVQFRVGPKS